MPTISEVAARATFADLVSRVAYGGERVMVTRRGERVAALVPAEDIALLELLEYELDLSQAREALADPETARSDRLGLRCDGAPQLTRPDADPRISGMVHILAGCAPSSSPTRSRSAARIRSSASSRS